MNKTDMEFFETYKRLDRLCSDVFGLKERRGDTLYR